jgi:hypothetical protein
MCFPSRAHHILPRSLSLSLGFLGFSVSRFPLSQSLKTKLFLKLAEKNPARFGINISNIQIKVRWVTCVCVCVCVWSVCVCVLLCVFIYFYFFMCMCVFVSCSNVYVCFWIGVQTTHSLCASCVS